MDMKSDAGKRRPRHQLMAMLLVLPTVAIFPAANAQASEVVKIARMVLTGKRVNQAPSGGEKTGAATNSVDESSSKSRAPFVHWLLGGALGPAGQMRS